jgi:hypothetical protein
MEKTMKKLRAIESGETFAGSVIDATTGAVVNGVKKAYKKGKGVE